MHRRPNQRTFIQVSFLGDNGANECNMALMPWEAGGKGVK